MFQRRLTAPFCLISARNITGGRRGRVCQSKCVPAPNQPPYTADYQPKVDEIAKSEFGGTTALDPDPVLPRLGRSARRRPNYIMQSPDVIVFLYNAAPYSTYRMIYLGGRPHPDMKTYETTYFGDSIGHWEGDTLVVDTVGFNDDTWLGGGGPIGTVQYTSIHSEKEHVDRTANARWQRAELRSHGGRPRSARGTLETGSAHVAPRRPRYGAALRGCAHGEHLHSDCGPHREAQPGRQGHQAALRLSL